MSEMSGKCVWRQDHVIPINVSFSCFCSTFSLPQHHDCSRWSSGYSTWWIALGPVASPWWSCAAATSCRRWPCWKKRTTSTRSPTTSLTSTSTSSTASSGSWTPTTTSTSTPKTFRDTTTTVDPQNAQGKECRLYFNKSIWMDLLK